MTLTPAKPLEVSKESSARYILIVEDDVATREMLSIFLETETSYRALAMADGEEVLQHIQELKEQRPILFLLDFSLPDMSALQLYDHLHSFQGFEQVPALILTAFTLTPEVELSITERSLTLLPKPFELYELFLSIEQTLE